MNIFVLHGDPATCASYHNDVHVVSQLKEGAQIMCTACHLLGLGHSGLYKPAQITHPCCKWAATSVTNLEWLLELVFALNREYIVRRQFRGKEQVDHRSLGFAIAAWDTVSSSKNAGSVPNRGLQNWPQVVPEKYKKPIGKKKVRFGLKEHPTITAYRNYYRKEKAQMKDSSGRHKPAKWTVVGKPPWW